jgi:hypothetical protein
MTLKQKNRLFNFVLILFSVGISLGVAELGLRFLYKNDSALIVKNYQSGPYLYDTDYWKVWHYPENRVSHIRDCFDVSYTTNSLGIRGNEPDLSKPNIAILGDSFIEGYGVDDNEAAVYILDSLIEDYNVLNFGTSGGFGTIHQLAQYENFVTHLKPEVVVLFFLNYNDLYDNAHAIEEGLINADFEFNYRLAANYDAVLSEINGQIPDGVVELSMEKSYLLGAVKKAMSTLSAQVQISLNTKLFDFNRRLAETYLPSGNAELQVGYEVLEKSLLRLKMLTERDGSKLILVQLADPYQIDENWLDLMQLKFDEELDPQLPNRNLEKLCSALDIEYFSMYDAAIYKIEQEDLKFPYLSYPCNRHYSPMGQEFMAQWFMNELADSF